MALVMRTVFSDLMDAENLIDLYMFCDGSPSSGYEVFMAVEWRIGLVQWRRQLLITFLGYGSMGLTDKLFSLLWDIFVECGPNEELLRWRLACIKGFCTDRGVEKGLCDDMLQ